MDIETAVDLTSTSWAKLAKAKLRGLTCTVVTETINSDKCWEEIKDLLWLKLYITNIHIYTSHFMDIQQKKNESHAAYVHRSKTKARRYNFTNAAATIRIFIKGLKNAYSFATHIHEKDFKHSQMPSHKWKAKWHTTAHGNEHLTIHS